jgi:hypothetical protein
VVKQLVIGIVVIVIAHDIGKAKNKTVGTGIKLWELGRSTRRSNKGRTTKQREPFTIRL